MIKFSPLLITILFILASPAGAATINFSANNYMMGLVTTGQTGTIHTNPILPSNSLSGSYLGGRSAIGVAEGYLPSMSEIIFTYTFSPIGRVGGENEGSDRNRLGSVLPGTLYAYGSYNYLQSGIHYSGSSWANSNDVNGSQGSTRVGNNPSVTAPSLVIVSAHIDSGSNKGTTTIINNSGSSAFYITALENLRRYGEHITVTYNVSAVPLPGTLPLFLLGLGIIAGLSYRRRKLAGI